MLNYNGRINKSYKPVNSINNSDSESLEKVNDVLIVDDNVFNIMCLRNMLKQKSIKSDSATDG